MRAQTSEWMLDATERVRNSSTGREGAGTPGQLLAMGRPKDSKDREAYLQYLRQYRQHPSHPGQGPAQSQPVG